jgi:AcrR family transcriptional regulator
MNQRESQKNIRRQRILDNAERLIRETGGTDFPIRTLAADSDVAFATPFNLFGSKEGLLYALLSRSLDQIMEEGLSFVSEDPADRALEATRNAVAAFFGDPQLLRPLYLVLLSVSHPDYRPRFMDRALMFWQTVATAAAGPGFKDPAATARTARSLLAHFVGLLEMWVHRDISDTQFEGHALIGTILLVRGIAQHMKAITQRLPDVGGKD